ncbi:MAG TPA: YggS family pyridoxal phosphate-dependent enzyme [Myxococcota bacterium]
MSAATEIGARLAAVRDRVRRAAERAGRSPDEIALVGVSKRKPAALVAEAVRAGLRHVGENYVQEAVPKISEVKELLDAVDIAAPRWHFIGALQRNKARHVAECFDLIETVDRAPLAEALEQRARAAGRTLEVLLQVNVSGESQKAGVDPEALPALLAASAAWPHLRVTGLMSIPAPEDDPEASRPAFARLRQLRDHLRTTPQGAGLRELSMGMSADFEVAIEEGATIIRVGTAIFGARDS